MTLQEIKQAIAEGKRVCWATPAYRVIQDSIGQYLIVCLLNDHCIGLTWQDNITLNGQEHQFFVI